MPSQRFSASQGLGSWCGSLDRWNSSRPRRRRSNRVPKVSRPGAPRPWTAFPIGPCGGAPPQPDTRGAPRTPPGSCLLPARSVFERRREAASAMASLGLLLSLLGLLLCVSARPRLSTSSPSKTEKPIIGRKEGRGPVWFWAPPAGSSSLCVGCGKHLGFKVRCVPTCTARVARRDPLWVLRKRSLPQ